VVVGTSCTLTNATWSMDSVEVGVEVQLIVEGEGCQLEEINYIIHRQGEWSWFFWNLFDHEVFSGVSGTSMNWVAGADVDGDIESGDYYFEAVSSDGTSGEVESGVLVVEGYYEAMKELLSALFFVKGLKSSNHFPGQ